MSELWQEAFSKRLVDRGLFVTATDTAVGKTAVSCGIVQVLRGAGRSVLPFKPMASGAERRGDGWLAEDAEALAGVTGGGATAGEVCPVVFERAVAPGIAAAELGERVDWGVIGQAWAGLQDRLGADGGIVIEGAGGVHVPLDAEGTPTVLELMAGLGWPALVVVRSALGTLNHSTLTVRALRDAGVPVVGLVMNDGPGLDADDASIATNRLWLERMTGASVLCRLPGVADGPPWEDGRWREALGGIEWWSLMRLGDG
ncbi:dethiobiotin synthase [Mucisphaera sp.]|uniref:dethiobiotin synthase n=1 Tax=Mucisphaera sp. TaxID=2913024 RepID=UPI003D13C964